MEEFFNEFGFIGKPQARRLQNSPNFCVFKYAQAVKQKVWNEAENRERDWGETLKIRFFSLASHALRACEAQRFPDFFTDFETTVLQSTGPRRVLTGFPVHSLPVVPACSLSSLLLLLVRKGRTPPLARRLCFTLGLPTTGLIAPGTCLDGNPIPGLSGALIELARLMLSGLSLVSNPLNVSALLGPFDPGPVTASDGVLPRVSLWGSSNEAPSNDTCWIAVTRDSLETNTRVMFVQHIFLLKRQLYSIKEWRFSCWDIISQRNIPYHQQILESYTDLSMMKGSRWVPKALRHFQEFVGVEEYSFAITLKLCFYLFAFTPMPVFNTGIKMYLNAVLLFAAIRDEFVRGFPITMIVI